jgi:hypothetical protein
MRYSPNLEMQPGNAPGLGETDRAHLRVWAAVFRQGLQDWAAEQLGILKYKETGVSEGEPTRWFDSPTDGVGSFCWLCGLFEIHPDQARSRAQAKKRELVRGVGQRF